MTFNQIAEHFAARWGKDVNRTHIASIMRLREKQSDQTLQFNKRARVSQHAPHLSLPAPPALSQSLPINPRAMMSPPARSMAPMSGLDLFNMLPQEMNKHTSPERPGTGTNCDRCPARFETRQVIQAARKSKYSISALRISWRTTSPRPTTSFPTPANWAPAMSCAHQKASRRLSRTLCQRPFFPKTVSAINYN